MSPEYKIELLAPPGLRLLDSARLRLDIDALRSVRLDAERAARADHSWTAWLAEADMAVIVRDSANALLAASFGILDAGAEDEPPVICIAGTWIGARGGVSHDASQLAAAMLTAELSLEGFGTLRGPPLAQVITENAGIHQRLSERAELGGKTLFGRPRAGSGLQWRRSFELEAVHASLVGVASPRSRRRLVAFSTSAAELLSAPETSLLADAYVLFVGHDPAVARTRTCTPGIQASLT